MEIDMTKTEALREFRIYMHDVRIEARRESYTPNARHCWATFVDVLREQGLVSPRTADRWIMQGPR